MPLDARLNTIDSAASTERLSASPLEMSGTGAPGRTATPIPTLPRLARSAATLPPAANSSSAAGGAVPPPHPSRPPAGVPVSRAVWEPLARVADAQHTDDVRVEPCHEGPWRGRGPDHAVPGDRFETRHARLRHGRKLGHRA